MFFRSRSHFPRYRRRLVPFSSFALLDSFSAVPRASSPIFMFCAPDSFSAVPRASGPIFMFCTPEHVFDGAECVRSRFHVMRTGTLFRRYRGCRVTFSCFAPDSFSAVPRALGPVLRSRTRFRQYRRHRVLFSCFFLPDMFLAVLSAAGPVYMFCAPDSFSAVPFSCFLRRDYFSAERIALGPVFIFCASRLVFGGTKGVRSRFHVLLACTRFRQYRGRRVPFS
jgi:hypothetical protein